VRIHKERALRTSPRSWGGWGLVVNNSSVRAPDRLDAVSTSARPAAKRFDVVMTIVLLVALPSLVYYLWICLAFNHGKPMIPSAGMFNYFPLPTGTSIGIVSGWLLFQAMLQQYAPGNWAEGTVLADGTRLAYRMNGWFAWWFTLLVLAGGVALNLFSPTILADQFGPLLTTANIFTYALSFYLYRHGKRHASNAGPSGNPVYDFWLGTALNPRIGSFDLKLFCEARPGLMAWIAIDLSLAAKQLESHGMITTPMILVCLFHFWYITDYFLHEDAILTTWDIKHESFGWMLCWGDLVWVPFTYTIQAYYLVDNASDLRWWEVAVIVLINVAGYVIFRGANLQKNRFRCQPERPIWGRPAQYIVTERGALLLTSGWWGLSRHMNYFGDLLMGLAWCLPCLFGSPLPYFYIFYLTVLLVHRERRDYAKCVDRHGKDWEVYCAKVHYRIIPGVY
jgi:protein-S-isoprenylcysteine O-methyltransferase Ste14